MKLNKILILTAVALLLSVSVCACGSKGTGTSTDSPAVKTSQSGTDESLKNSSDKPEGDQTEDTQKNTETEADAGAAAPAESGTEGNQMDADTAAPAESGTAEEQDIAVTADPAESGTAENQMDADGGATAESGITEAQGNADTAAPAESEEETTAAAPTLLYQGQGSLQIRTPEDRVIYIDPYSGDSYDLQADLILITHGHFDHNQPDLVQNRNGDCRIITWNEAISDGVHQVFDLEYVKVEAVEAGYNQNHDVSQCVGYILTFSNGKSVYVTGDTSTTQQMPLLAEKNIDYAFFCCDGVYNMDAAEASKCAEMVGAKHNLPYHTSAKNDGYNFDRDVAEQFEADNKIILAPGDELVLDGH